MRYEKSRNKIIKANIDLIPNGKILDLGGCTGERMKSLFPNKTEGIYIANISEKALDVAKNHNGYNTILLYESRNIPF